jgi:hypothetical protein
MPYLFCGEHGRDREVVFAQEQENYRRFGETVLVVRGPLKSASWRCDSCHARLRRGNTAWLVTAFPRSTAAGMDGYDFAQEREYFDMERAEVTVYGTPWPGVARASG